MKIFLKIFLFAAFFIIISRLYGGTIIINDRLSVHFDNLIAAEKIEFISAYMEKADSEVKKLMKKRKNADAISLKLKLFYDKLQVHDNQTFALQEQSAEIYLGNIKSIDCRNDFAFREKLISLILQSYIGDSHAVKAYQAPRWLALAIDNRIPRDNLKWKPIVKIRNMQGLKLLLLGDADLHPEQFKCLNGKELNSIDVLIMGDMARFTLDLCMIKNNHILLKYLHASTQAQNRNESDSNLLAEIIIPYLQNQSEQYFAEQQKIRNQFYRSQNKKIVALTDEERDKNFRRYLKIMAKKHAFYSGSPYPAVKLQAELEKLRTIQVREFDANNNYSNNYQTFDLTQLPLLMRERPDAELIKYDAISAFMNFQFSASLQIAKKTQNLIDLLQNCRNSLIFGTSQRSIANALDELKQVIAEQIEFEDFLYQTESEYLNFYQRYPYEIKTIEEYFNSMGSSEIQKFMLETEEKFYGTF